LFGQIIVLDEDAFEVAFVERGERLSPRLDVSDASFEVGRRVVEVKRSETDVLKFEELSQ